MATTSLWHIEGRLKDLIDYVEGPEKTASKMPELQDLYNAVCADVIGPAYSPDTEHAKKVSKEHHQYQNPTHVRPNHCGIYTCNGHS